MKYASLLFAAVMLAACTGQSGEEGDEPQGPVGNKTLKLEADKNLIQTFGGDYATLTVTLDGEKVTDGLTFFDGDNNVIEIENLRFYAEESGLYEIWVNYLTYNSEPVSIRAISIALPQTPVDPSPSSTDFVPRVLLSQFTTTGCIYCPQMKLLLKKALDESYAEKVVKVDCHSSIVNDRNDPAYIYTGFEDFCNTPGLPSINLDMYHTSGDYNMSDTALRSLIDGCLSFKTGKAAGIAVNSSITDDDQVVAKVTFKAAETGSYRVGAFLLEDNIVATGNQTQTGSGVENWMNTHNSCIRYIDAMYYSGGEERYYGHSVGTVEKGNTADYLFVFDLEQIWADGKRAARQNSSTWSDKWNEEELRLAVFVSTIGENADGEEFYYTNNVIECSADGQTQYEYVSDAL